MKRNAIIFIVLVVACTLTLTILIVSAITQTANTGSGGVRDTSLSYGTVGTSAGIPNNSYAQKTAAGEAAPSIAAGAASAPTTDVAAPADANAGTAEKQRIVRTGSLSLRVQDAPGALEQVKTLAAAKGGFVESSSISDTGSGPRTAYATIRVPVASFDGAMADLKKVASVVLDESTNANDVTMQYVDLESNLRNARAEEQSYLDLLKRTGSMNDVLSVTRALADVRGRIEQLDGEQRYMQSQTDDATINVTLTEETRIEVPTRTWKPLEVLRQAFSELVISLQGLVDVLIRFVIGFVGLFVPVAFLVLLFIWLSWKIFGWVIRKLFRPRP